MSRPWLLLLLGLALVAIGACQGGGWWLAAWLGFDFLLLGIAHTRSAHKVFGKRPDGSLPWWSWLLFLPLLLYTTVVWHLLRLISNEPAHGAVSQDLTVGRRLLAGELDGEFDNYVDLTAEFSEPATVRRRKGYRSFPILDGSAPPWMALREAVKSLGPGRTYVHCAQGHGRTGLFALAILLKSGEARTVDEGLEKLRKARPGIRLTVVQRRCIEELAAGHNT